MKKKKFKFIKKQWLLAWTIIVSVVLLAVVASAEYPGTNNYMKRVVVYDETSEMMFSSNLLTLIDNDKIQYQPCYVRQLTDTEAAQTYDVDVFVWNYDIDGSGDYYKKAINYDLEIRVVNNQGNVISSLDSGKIIQIFENDSSTALTAFSNSNVTYSKSNISLATGNRTQNKYTIKFSKNWDLTNDANKRVEIKVTPSPASQYPDLRPLAAAIGLKKETSGQSSGWEYYINEKTLPSTATPQDYDAYNLVLTGSGSKTITIEWDTSKVALNKDFYEPSGAFPFITGEVVHTPGGGSATGWDRLVINADSYDATKNYRNRYDIQVYKVNGELGSTWGFIGDTITTGIYITITMSTT